MGKIFASDVHREKLIIMSLVDIQTGETEKLRPNSSCSLTKSGSEDILTVNLYKDKVFDDIDIIKSRFKDNIGNPKGGKSLEDITNLEDVKQRINICSQRSRGSMSSDQMGGLPKQLEFCKDHVELSNSLPNLILGDEPNCVYRSSPILDTSIESDRLSFSNNKDSSDNHDSKGNTDIEISNTLISSSVIKNDNMEKENVSDNAESCECQKVPNHNIPDQIVQSLSNPSIPVTLPDNQQNPDSSHKSNLYNVLENIPLIYLPQTKQLIPASTFPHKTSSISSDTNLSDCDTLTNASTELVLSSGADHTFSSQSCDTNLKKMSEDSGGDLSSGHENVNEKYSYQADNETSADNFHRTNTSTSLSRTDASSFSSISSVSTGTDFSASVGDDIFDMKGVLLEGDEAGFMEINLHSRNSYERPHNSSQDSGIDEKMARAKPKKNVISGFLSR